MRSRLKNNIVNVFICLASLTGAGAMAEGLSLRQAEQLALENDYLVRGLQSSAQAFDDQAVAADTWPDPRLKFGVLALPTDTYDLDQEPMTQVILGYTQALPRGDSQQYAMNKMQAMAGNKRQMAELRKRQVIKMVRMAWLDVYLQERAENIIRRTRVLFQQQVDVSQSLYASGRGKQQDVLQAELEISLLDDRLEDIIARKREARARLSQWVGEAASERPLDTESPRLQAPEADELFELKQALESHPLVKAKQAMVDKALAEVEISNEKYAPQWMFDVTYGKRDGLNMDGSDRADFLSAVVNVDIPLFTENRQDRQLSASRKQLQAARYEKLDTQAELQSQLQQVHARWQQLNKRLGLYDHDVVTRARQNARAAFNGYQSGVVPFFTLTRARTAELKTELQRLKLEVKAAMALADMDFLAGEYE